MSLDLRNCPRCGKLFAYDGKHKLCEVCRKDEEDDYQKVKEYLWDNAGATIDEVHEKTGVPRDTIIKFVKEERLLSEGLDIEIDLECERCGAPILHGRFCEKCKAELVSGFSEDDKKKKEEKKSVKNDMFIKDRIKKKKEK